VSHPFQARDPATFVLTGRRRRIVSFQHCDRSFYSCPASCILFTKVACVFARFKPNSLTLAVTGVLAETVTSHLSTIGHIVAGSAVTGVALKGTQATQLRFSNNGVTGTIPAAIGEMTSLTLLFFQLNSGVTGILPPQIGNLTSLSFM
jgi:hypothetical protein